MTYVKIIKNDLGDVVDYETFCETHRVEDSGAWPYWDRAADCLTCGAHLRAGSGDKYDSCAHTP